MMELLLARLNTSMKEHMQEISAEMKADRKSNREDLKGMMEEMMNTNQAEMRYTVCAIRSELKETAACHEATEADTEKTEPDSGMMQSIVEHQVALKEDAVVKLVKGRKKRHRVRKPAAG
jgi:actin-related protein